MILYKSFFDISPVFYGELCMVMVIGLVGEPGGGKGSFIGVLREIMGDIPVDVVRSSDILRATLELWGIDFNRKNCDALVTAIKERFGAGSLTKAVCDRIRHMTAPIVIFDGVRLDTDVSLVRSFANNRLVYVTAEQETRYRRTRSRKEKVGEADKTFEQFQEEESAPNECHIPRIGSNADFTITNNSSFGCFQQQITTFYSTLSIQ